MLDESKVKGGIGVISYGHGTVKIIIDDYEVKGHSSAEIIPFGSGFTDLNFLDFDKKIEMELQDVEVGNLLQALNSEEEKVKPDMRQDINKFLKRGKRW